MGNLQRDENGRLYRWGANWERQYISTEPIGGCGCLLIFSTVVAAVITIIIMHAIHHPLP
jgi:hypothetical protein